MGVLDQILSTLANSKQVDELPTATTVLGSDWAIIWNNANQRAEKIPISTIQASTGWLWIEDSYVEKGAGNESLTTLEDGDIVYFKKITNAGDPITLVGHTYDPNAVGGLDKELETSYELLQSISV